MVVGNERVATIGIGPQQLKEGRNFPASTLVAAVVAHKRAHGVFVAVELCFCEGTSITCGGAKAFLELLLR